MTHLKIDRIYWSCRRGMLELDLILIPFSKYKYLELTPSLQQQFQALLECTDVELYAWLTGRSEPEQAEFVPIITLIRTYAADPSRPRSF